jgi:hypothetical protein
LKPPVSGGFFHGRLNLHQTGNAGDAAGFENKNARASEHLCQEAAENCVYS